jgi:3-isopropylmalate dehydrogenase
VTKQSIRVLNAIAERFGHTFTYHEALIGADAIDKTGTALPSETIDTCLDSDAVLFGAVGHPKYDNDPNAKVRPEQGILGIRKALQLFAIYAPLLLTRLYSTSALSNQKIWKVLILSSSVN